MIYHLGEKKVEIHGKHVFIAPSADLVGAVIIHNHVSIWFRAVLRGDLAPIEIGEESNIQDGVVVHVDEHLGVTVGKGCIIGHNAILHACRIGDGTLVGMGAVVLSGSKIGNNCLIAAGSLVPQGAVVPDNSLFMGSPGKVVKEIKPALMAGMKKGAALYVASIDEYNQLMVEESISNVKRS